MMGPRRLIACGIISALMLGGVFHFGTPIIDRVMAHPSSSIILGGATGASIEGAADSAPDGFGEWTVVSQGVDQEVTNSVTLVNSNLCFTLVTDRSYEFQARFKYSASSALAGMRFNVTVPATTTGYFDYGLPNAPVDTGCVPVPCAADPTPIVFGALHTQPQILWATFSHIRAPRSPNPGGPFCIAFANSAAGVGHVTRLWGISTLSFREIVL